MKKPPNSKNYSPDPNGYFVCKANTFITNVNLCKLYKGNSLKFNNDKIPFNNNCEVCKIDLKKVKTESLEKYSELSETLQDYINNQKPNSSIFVIEPVSTRNKFSTSRQFEY